MIIQIFFTLVLAIQFTIADDWDSDKVSTDLEMFNVELFSDGYKIPWGMAFLPDGSLLVNDISGKMYKRTSRKLAFDPEPYSVVPIITFLL